MNVLPLGSDQVNSSRREFPVVAVSGKDLGAIGKELGSPAFIRLYVGGLTADDGVIRLAKGSEHQGIGRSAVKGKENLAVGFKQLPEGISRGRSPGVVPVARDVAVIGGFHGRPGLRADAGIIVACELLQKIGALDIGHTLL